MNKFTKLIALSVLVVPAFAFAEKPHVVCSVNEGDGGFGPVGEPASINQEWDATKRFEAVVDGKVGKGVKYSVTYDPSNADYGFSLRIGKTEADNISSTHAVAKMLIGQKGYVFLQKDSLTAHLTCNLERKN